MSISVNRDENKFRFIITLVHEIAHLKTYLEFRNRVNPHGEEWKNNYRFLFRFFGLDWMFQENEQTREIYNREIQNPRACSGIDLEHEKALSSFDNETASVFLDELAVGERFSFRKHTYQKLEERRTRVLCLNLANGKKYTINKASKVTLLEN